MKKIALILSFVFLFAACEKGYVRFTVHDSVESTIKSSAPINLPFDIPIPTVESTAEEEYENNKTTPDLIKEVTLESLSITITDPEDKTFSFLKSIHIYIKKSDGTEKQEIAYLDNINSEAKTINLKTKDVNLVPYLKESTYKLETKVEVKEYLTKDVDIRIDLTFKVLAKVL